MGAKACAEAVLASLPEGGSCHIAGHSFGGAVATLCVLMQPGRFNGATLLSPGGFGPGINADAMRALAEAGDAAAVRRAFEPFHAPGFVLPSAVVDAAAQARQRPGARAALRDLLGIILKEDGTQGVLPLARLAASPVPLTLVWGVQDAILPVAQGQAFPAARSVMLEGVGHMLHDEAPDAVVDAILRGLQL
jgi:pyruvate dehydrogenase E2 component (dihydrolipoamide acetyltransferase)